jgi:hypothetical protein
VICALLAAVPARADEYLGAKFKKLALNRDSTYALTITHQGKDIVLHLDGSAKCSELQGVLRITHTPLQVAKILKAADKVDVTTEKKDFNGKKVEAIKTLDIIR